MGESRQGDRVEGRLRVAGRVVESAKAPDIKIPNPAFVDASKVIECQAVHSPRIPDMRQSVANVVMSGSFAQGFRSLDHVFERRNHFFP